MGVLNKNSFQTVKLSLHSITKIVYFRNMNIISYLFCYCIISINYFDYKD